MTNGLPDPDTPIAVPGGARAEDGGPFRAWWGRWGRDLITLLAVGLSAWAVITTQGSLDKIESETEQRIDETCRISETKQANDIEALRATYEYLSGLERGQLDEPLNKAVLAGLPRTVREAQTDDAPDYCDAKTKDDRDIGLPEPDVAIPTPPPGLEVPAPDGG